MFCLVLFSLAKLKQKDKWFNQRVMAAVAFFFSFVKITTSIYTSYRTVDFTGKKLYEEDEVFVKSLSTHTTRER